MVTATECLDASVGGGVLGGVFGVWCCCCCCCCFCKVILTLSS